ncbi:hypothetical protein [Epilithonimonas zeae]|uniref:hypothetical protein n=1 Tax=Epilithonimonas zeae TaxID=1416779 RepID=UPI00200ED50D|nr:hypothetical protein [Epilithonimonas zeae]UQB69146.1 hypothetical protein KI430_01510 [Epilithonimonas zeae]
MTIAIIIQNGEAKTIAKINIGIMPFKPAVMMLSIGKRIPIEVKMQAIIIPDKLSKIEMPTSCHFVCF